MIALATILFMVGVSCASGSVVGPPLVPSPAFINTVPYAVPPYATRVDLVTRGLKTPFVAPPLLPAPSPYLPPSSVLPRFLPSSAVLPAPSFPRVLSPHGLPGPVLPPRVFPSPILPPGFPPRVYPSPFLPGPFFPNYYGGAPFPGPFPGPFTIPGALFPPFFYRR